MEAQSSLLRTSKLNPAAAAFRPREYSPIFYPQNPYYYSTPSVGLTTVQSRDQYFDKFIVIDFEATCDKVRLASQEIIEFPAVIVDAHNGQIEGCFQTYVRPTNNRTLSDYCKDLTGIQQIQVDSGISLSEALSAHDEWLEKKGIKKGKFAVVTWGDWDCKTMLESECRLKNIPKPAYFNRWINLKVPYVEMFGGTTRTNLKEAVEKGGLVWEGRQHCGLDDSKNTAHLLSLLLRRGYTFSITAQLNHS